jgi:membrane protein YdbS with pleckstrin-like domain
MITAEPAAPCPVRAAGVLVVLQGLAGVAVAVALLVAAVRGSTGPVPVGATAAWLAGFGGILLLVGANLVRGRRGARTPAIVAQLLLLGVCWYAAGPSSQLAYGAPAAAFCVAVLVLLFCPPALRWATRTHRQAR